MTHKGLAWVAIVAIAQALVACGGGGSGTGGESTTSSTSSGTGGTGTTSTSTGGTGTGGTGPSVVCGDGVVEGTEACDDGNKADADGCDASCALESGYTCSGAPSACVTTCGDGITAGSEACDDGGTADGDGCDASCTIESGYTCSGDPSVCVTTCGDGVMAGTEACDDGNTADDDGCSMLCEVESGWSCSGDPSVCETACGDGIVAGTEVCDDGGMVDGDGCDASCAPENGWTCSGEPSACVTTCGDGIVAGTEACDDGGTVDGDGCDASCAPESGYTCSGSPSACVTTCGDGIVAGAEACDDSGTADGDGCSAMCLIETGYACSGSPSICASVCGDGILAGMETCDDSGTTPGDGCDAACATETGWTCAGAPSACATICGDGLVLGLEACDDANLTDGDGCSAMCAVEPGYACVSQPSSCSAICGDGIVAGTEACDDGNGSELDGCKSNCQFATGESCAEPLAVSQATVNGSAYTWNIPGGSVVVEDGAFACDPNTHGPDAVITYTKTTADLANGGKLLHVNVDTTQTSTGYYFNVEVVAGACGATGVSSAKCLWYKHDWDTYLDLPAGDYQIWIGKNSPATATVLFPATTVLVEEIDATAAEGEGCFAPFTSTSSIYTPPAGAGAPHTWTVPASINSFDMGTTWGEPGSISCDNHATYGDIHGVDAVIEFDKQSPLSVLLIDAQNLDPTLSQSDLDLEVLSVCDPLNLAKVSRNCRANKDTISITAPSPAGPAYIWLATEATSEEFRGATVQVTEIFPGVGESWPTAEPLVGSGPIAPTSTQRYDAPSCFPAVAAIHWYSYTLTNDALSLGTDFAGTIGVYDVHGQEKACTTDASAAPLGFSGVPGDTFYIAVASPSPITSLTIADVVYHGVQGIVTDMQFTFPSSALSEFGMAVSAGEIFMGDTSKIWSIPKTIGATAVLHDSADGLTTTQLGYDIVFANGSLFSVDSTTTTNVSRLFRVFDGATWGPTAWDLNPVYPASQGSYAIATDGAQVFLSTRRTTVSANFYSFPSNASAAPALIGTNTSVWYVVGMAADDLYFYVASNGVSGEGVYRLSRADVTAPALKIATLDTSTTSNNIEVDSFVAPQNLYVRAYGGDVHAIVDPQSPVPVSVGAILTLGTTSDYAMAYDKVDGSLYLFETETDSAGRIIRVQ